MATDYAALWQALNPRQQYYLKPVFEEDQAREAARREASARGAWDSRPAAQWRAIDAYHEPPSKTSAASQNCRHAGTVPDITTRAPAPP
ncbi:hypothetical protein [Streptomyces olivochromogenes]|uniref:hypothetical protein n=1 Tax=Streptomyces olivochromogenes TaxID=1963 RepID=UPI001F18B453|nr:hypothetical protein [Streptomyces olivochromogenes]MCF3136828.1 hypothetical protein [Streptomyces olivochromogenes]